MSEDIYTHIPYTYLIKFKPTGQVYYGVRYSKKCDPIEFWQEGGYFTSSKVVHQLIEEHGKDAFEYEIRKTFDCADKAIEWESTVLKKMGVVKNDKWLNKTDNDAIEPMTGEKNPMFGRKHSEKTKKEFSKKRKGKFAGENNPFYGKKHDEKTKEKMKGKKRSPESKQKMSEYAKNRKEEHKKNLSDSLRGKFAGENNPMFGRNHSHESLKKISDSLKGKMTGEDNPFYGKNHNEETKEKLRISALNRKRFPCRGCGREITKQNLLRHEKVCTSLLDSSTNLC